MSDECKKFIDELPVADEFVIKIKGPGYEGQLDSSVAAAIVDIQDAIYKIAKVAAFGSDAGRKRLPAEVRQKLNFAVEVRPGCTEIAAAILAAFTEIAKAWGPKMTGDQIKEIVQLLIFVFGGGYLTKSMLTTLVERFASYKEKKAEGEQQQEMARLQNEHDRIFADAILKAARVEGDRVVENSAKRFPEATEIDFPQKHYSSAELAEIRSRAPRIKSARKTDTGEFYVQDIDLKDRPAIYVGLREAKTSKVLKLPRLQIGGFCYR